MDNIIERRAYLIVLFDIYSPMLTEKQKNMFDLYHQCDLSLGEIAEETMTSRQAVFDVLKRTENALEDYECKLHLAQKEEEEKAALQKLRNLVFSDNSERKTEILDIIDGLLKK